MTTTPSTTDRSIDDAGSSWLERIERLDEAQRRLMGRHWNASRADLDRLDVVADRFILTADLGMDEARKRARLADWVATGAEWYLDVRIEADEREFLAEHAPHLRYIRVPTDDDLEAKGPEFWTPVLEGLGDALHDGSIGIVTCAMAVNRGPSALFRVLLELEWPELAALEEIATARPVAQVVYAVDAFEDFILSNIWTDRPSDPRR